MSLALVFCAAAGAARPAGAQVAVHASLAAGPTSATSHTIQGDSHGWTGDAALWLSLAHLPVGLRVDVSRAWLGERRVGVICAASIAAPCPVFGYRDATTAGSLSLTYSLGGSRVSPYVLVGAGAYHLETTETHPTTTCPPGASCPLMLTILPESHSASTHFGASAGAGVAVRVWRMELTTEVRYHSYSRDDGRGHMVPVTFGLRL
jgi:hypothetical protein